VPDAQTRRWPAVSIADAYRILTAPGMPFEMETREINGRRVRTYTRNFPSLRAVFEQSLRWGSREYLVFENDRLTYDAHYRAAAALARTLAGQYGIRKGDRVAIAVRNYPEWAIAFWAAAAAGAVITPLNAWGMADELQYGITNSGSKVAFVDAERLERLMPLRNDLGGAELVAVRTPRAQLNGVPLLEDLIGPASGYGALADLTLPDVQIEPEDDATIFYTSGTTGRPKGALGTHRNILTNILNIDFQAALALVRRGLPPPVDDPNAPQKIGLLPAPFFHVTGCHSNLVPAMAKGRKIVLMYKWNAEQALELIERERINTTSGVPSMAWQLLESPDFARRDLSSIEGVSYGGAAAAPELTLRVAKALPKVLPRQAYGATETSSVSTSISGEDYQHRPNSVGTPSPVCDIRIVREDGSEAPVGESGEIWISGPNVVKGYWNNPEATRAAFSDGWYHTGDVGKVDEEGFVYVLDRIKDMLIRGGENIYCVEIESVLYTHAAVLDAAVIGLPHRVLGEEVGAVIQLKPGHEATEEDFRRHVAEQLANHKVPVVVDVRTDELPKNASGKTLKRVLRDELVSAGKAKGGT
jgi:long-chain acyl-CoA synthetase